MIAAPRRNTGAGARGETLAAIALALLIGVGFLVEGYDGLFGGDIVCIGFSAVLVWLLANRAPKLHVWRALALPLGLLAAGLAWAVAGSIPGGDAVAAAPDQLPQALAARWGMLAALLCGALLGARRLPIARFVMPLLMIGAAGILLSLALRNLGDDAPWLLWRHQNESRLLGTLGNANVAAAVYGSLATLAFAAALDAMARTTERIGWESGALLLCAILAFGAEILTASRTGTVLTVAALLLVGATAFPRRRIRARLIGGMMLIGAVALISMGLLTERVQRIGDDIALRPMMWRYYAGIAAEAPWRGHGLGTFSALNIRHLDSVRLGEALWTVNAPHEIWLALALEGGLPWLLATLAAIALIALRIVAGFRARARRLEVGAAGAVLIVLGLASVDIAFEMPAVAGLALVLAGWLWGRALRPDALHPVGVGEPRVVPAQQQVAIAR